MRANRRGRGSPGQQQRPPPRTPLVAAIIVITAAAAFAAGHEERAIHECGGGDATKQLRTDVVSRDRGLVRVRT